MKKTIVALAAALGTLAALPAAAQFQKPEDAVKYRQSAMALQSNHLGRLFGMANGRVPYDAKVAADQIEIVAMLNKLQFVAFVDGSDKVAGTKAKPEIWSQRDKWNAAVAKSQDDVTKLVAAGKVGTLDALKAAVGPVGGSCKGCHDDFRN